jgi:hypothetical protein
LVDFFQLSALASHWLEDCANFTPMPGESNQYSAVTLSVIQASQANPLLLMNNYAPLVISRNDKNKQLTLLTAINKPFAL